MPTGAQLLSGGQHLLYGMAREFKVGNRARRALRAAVAGAALVAAFAALAAAWPRQSATQPGTPAPAAGQQPQTAPPAPAPAPPAQQAPPVFRFSREEVIVPVLVRNHSGDPVLNLEKKDFRILEDDVEQKISSFANEPFPLSVVFLVDDDLPDRTAKMVDQSLTAVLGGLAEGDELAVVLFAQYPRTVVEFGSDQDKLQDALKRTDLAHRYPLPANQTMTSAPNPTPNTQASEIGVPQSARIRGRESKDLDDAVFYCGEMLHPRPRERRKLLLIVSDGRNSHNNATTYAQALHSLLSSDVSVYGVGVSEAVLDRKRAAIGKYVDATGGDVFYASSRNALEEDYTRILEESRNRYTLAYAPTGTDRSKEFHQIEVRIERPGLKVTARDGYYVLVPKK